MPGAAASAPPCSLGSLTIGSVATLPGRGRAGAEPADPGSRRSCSSTARGPTRPAGRHVVRRLQADRLPRARARRTRSAPSPATPPTCRLSSRPVDGPIVLVGHSYGASVITNAADRDPDVQALVYVNGSVPAEGETVAELAGPDSALSVSDPTTIFNFVPGHPPADGGERRLPEEVDVPQVVRHRPHQQGPGRCGPPSGRSLSAHSTSRPAPRPGKPSRAGT